MNFSQAFKVFQLNILRQSGIAVTPQQLGLKSDPIADLQAKNNLPGSFGNILNRMGAANLTPPTPPVPPTDPADSAAQSQYQQDLLGYTQNMQLYNQRFMQLLLHQFQMMQQTLASQQQTNSSSLTGSDPTRAIGSILGGVSDS